MTRAEATQLLTSLRTDRGDLSTSDRQGLEVEGGSEREARDRLFALAYQELRRKAHFLLRRERADHTLRTTALVHEVYLKLFDNSALDWNDRTHFCNIAARAMRQVLMNWARDRNSQKRGGQAPGGDRWQRVDLTSADALGALPVQARAGFLLDLDAALDRLAERSPRQAQVLELSYFAGLTQKEIGAELDVAEKTVRRDLQKAWAWLRCELEDGAEPTP